MCQLVLALAAGRWPAPFIAPFIIALRSSRCSPRPVDLPSHQLLGLESDDIDIALDDHTGAQFADMVNAILVADGVATSSVGIIKRNPEQSKVGLVGSTRAGKGWLGPRKAMQSANWRRPVAQRGVGRTQHLETATVMLYDRWIDFVNLRSETYELDSRIPDKMVRQACARGWRRLAHTNLERAYGGRLCPGVWDARAGCLPARHHHQRPLLQHPDRGRRGLDQAGAASRPKTP